MKFENILIIVFYATCLVKTKCLVVWISMDGFRNDYLDVNETPNLYNLAQNAVVSKNNKPVFTSQTYPNHFSQATGLYTENHGILSNKMYDANLGKFNKKTEGMEWWDPENKIRPLWVINQKNGGKSAVVYWTAFNIPFDGILPTFTYDKFEHFDGDTPYRLNVGLEKIVSGEYNLVMIFIEDPDDSGHAYGPDDPERVRIVKEMDKSIGDFITTLKEAGIYEKIDFMFSSDHGMIDTPKSKEHNITDLFSDETITVINTGVTFEVSTDLLTAQSIKDTLSEFSWVAEIYLKDEIPKYLHYNHSTRTPTLLVIPQPGHTILYKSIHEIKGDHGYPIELTQKMQAFFMTFGPSINNKAILEESSNVDLFSIACHLLNLDKQCGETDGVLPKNIFKQNGPDLRIVVTIPVLSIVVVVAVSVTLYFVLTKRNKTKNNA